MSLRQRPRRVRSSPDRPRRRVRRARPVTGERKAATAAPTAADAAAAAFKSLLVVVAGVGAFSLPLGALVSSEIVALVALIAAPLVLAFLVRYLLAQPLHPLAKLGFGAWMVGWAVAFLASVVVRAPDIRTVATVAGICGSSDSPLMDPTDIVLTAGGSLWIVDHGSSEIIAMRTDQNDPRGWRRVRLDEPHDAPFPGLSHIAKGEGAMLYFAAFHGQKLYAYDPLRWGAPRPLTGTALTSEDRRGHVDGEADTARFHYPLGLAYDSSAHALFVADKYNHAVRRVDLPTPTRDTASAVSTVLLKPGTIPFEQPYALAFHDGHLYVTASYSKAVYKLIPRDDGSMDADSLLVKPKVGSEADDTALPDSRAFPDGLAVPEGVAVTKSAVYLSSRGLNRIYRLAADDRGLDKLEVYAGTVAGAQDGPALKASFYEPAAIVADDSVEPPILYVVDRTNRCIRKVHMKRKECGGWLGERLTCKLRGRNAG